MEARWNKSDLGGINIFQGRNRQTVIQLAPMDIFLTPHLKGMPDDVKDSEIDSLLSHSLSLFPLELLEKIGTGPLSKHASLPEVKSKVA